MFTAIWIQSPNELNKQAGKFGGFNAETLTLHSESESFDFELISDCWRLETAVSFEFDCIHHFIV